LRAALVGYGRTRGAELRKGAEWAGAEEREGRGKELGHRAAGRGRENGKEGKGGAAGPIPGWAEKVGRKIFFKNPFSFLNSNNFKYEPNRV